MNNNYLFNLNSLDNKGSCWILKDFYCSVTMLYRELGLIEKFKGKYLFMVLAENLINSLEENDCIRSGISEKAQHMFPTAMRVNNGYHHIYRLI